VRVTLYDASVAFTARFEMSSRPLDAVPSVEVEVQDGWQVADVLMAGGHGGFDWFALVTPEIEADVAVGEHYTIDSAFNLVGINDDGRVKFQTGSEGLVRWIEFLRAAEKQLYRGDPTRIVVYPYGAAGGPGPDGLWEAIQWLFGNHDLAVHVMEDIAKAGGGIWALTAGGRWVKGVRRRQIAKQWRAQGFTAASIRDYLARCPQWDPSEFARQTYLTESEALLALTTAGYEAGPDGLWRPAVEGRQRRKALDEIVERAEADFNASPEDGRSDDFPLDEEESEDDR
jgi:hypothetical protein